MVLAEGIVVNYAFNCFTAVIGIFVLPSMVSQVLNIRDCSPNRKIEQHCWYKIQVSTQTSFVLNKFSQYFFKSYSRLFCHKRRHICYLYYLNIKDQDERSIIKRKKSKAILNRVVKCTSIQMLGISLESWVSKVLCEANKQKTCKRRWHRLIIIYWIKSASQWENTN